MTPPPDIDPPKKTTVAFEQSLARLETIVKEMESGRLSLDQLMVHFEEGAQLVKHCGTTLNDVEQKIEQLIRKGDQLETAPFEPETEHHA